MRRQASARSVPRSDCGSTLTWRRPISIETRSGFLARFTYQAGCLDEPALDATTSQALSPSGNEARIVFRTLPDFAPRVVRSEEHTSELQSHSDLVCRLLLEKKKNTITTAVRTPPHRSVN